MTDIFKGFFLPKVDANSDLFSQNRKEPYFAKLSYNDFSRKSISLVCLFKYKKQKPGKISECPL